MCVVFVLCVCLCVVVCHCVLFVVFVSCLLPFGSCTLLVVGCLLFGCCWLFVFGLLVVGCWLLMCRVVCGYSLFVVWLLLFVGCRVLLVVVFGFRLFACCRC